MACPIPKPIGNWTALKLEYLDHYLQAYRNATKSAVRGVYYIDLFANCGDCILPSGCPVDGSAWRALKVIPSFTKCFFAELKPEFVNYLETRIRNAGINNTELFPGDCNLLVDKILSHVPKSAPSFAFLDPSGLQLRWSTVEKLASHRRGYWKMELLILYPYDMAIKRFISQETFAPALSSFYGNDVWRNEYKSSVLAQEDEKARRGRFVALYVNGLKNLGYKFVQTYGPLGYGRRYYYNVIFAGDHPIGAKIMNQVWSKPRAIPGQLDYMPIRRPTGTFQSLGVSVKSSNNAEVGRVSP
jgi:three-Cys-motif partner protein